MTEEHCVYCNTALSRTNVLRALEEAGLPQDCLVFACASYNPATRKCYGTHERQAALWCRTNSYPDYRPEL